MCSVCVRRVSCVCSVQWSACGPSALSSGRRVACVLGLVVDVTQFVKVLPICFKALSQCCQRSCQGVLMVFDCVAPALAAKCASGTTLSGCCSINTIAGLLCALSEWPSVRRKEGTGRRELEGKMNFTSTGKIGNSNSQEMMARLVEFPSKNQCVPEESWFCQRVT